jgi:hypothetical protein
MAEAFAIRLIDALETDEPHMRIHDGQHLLSCSRGSELTQP